MRRFSKRIAVVAITLVVAGGLIVLLGAPLRTTGQALIHPGQWANYLQPGHWWKPRTFIPEPAENQEELAPDENEAGRASPVGPLPWENTPRFKKALEDNGTPILMAAYKASLPDPILNERYNIALAADMLAGTVVQPGEIFSQNRCIGPYTEARGFRAGPTYAGNRITTTTGGGVCKIASLLYNVAILSNLEIIERHPHSLTVPYVPPGQDATVAYGARDFRFRNNTAGPVLIWAQSVGDTLYMAFYGQEHPPTVTWHHQTLKRIKSWTEYRYNPALPPGSRQVVMPGQDGIVVRSWITIEAPSEVIRKDLGVNYYNPSPRIIEKGPPA